MNRVRSDLHETDQSASADKSRELLVRHLRLHGEDEHVVAENQHSEGDHAQHGSVCAADGDCDYSCRSCDDGEQSHEPAFDAEEGGRLVKGTPSKVTLDLVLPFHLLDDYEPYQLHDHERDDEASSVIEEGVGGCRFALEELGEDRKQLHESDKS